MVKSDLLLQGARRWKKLAVFVTGLVIATTLVGASPAQAHHVIESRVKYYSSENWVHLSDLGVCARIVAKGKIAYDYSPASGRYTARVENARLQNPKVTVTTYERRGSSCVRNNKKVGEMRITQRWSGYSCSFDPAIGVSFPWGVSVEGWASCGNETQAHHKTTYTRDTWLYEQSNSGTKVNFGRVAPKSCFGYDIDVVVWNVHGNRSDSASIPKQKACIW